MESKSFNAVIGQKSSLKRVDCHGSLGACSAFLNRTSILSFLHDNDFLILAIAVAGITLIALPALLPVG